MITRTQAETLLVGRRSAQLSFVGLSVLTDGTNPACVDPLALAIRLCDGTVASPVDVTDTDLLTVAEEDLDKLLDLAEYRLLLSIQGNFAGVDTTAGPFTERLSQFAKELTDEIEALRKKLEDEYDIGAVQMSVGMITQDFVSHDDDSSV